PEAPERVDPEVRESEHAVGQPLPEPLVERQDQGEDREGQDHLVGDLGVDDLAGLAERVGVHVGHAPGQVRRRAVVLAVDDVADAADRQADHGAGAAAVDDLPERKLRAPRPQERADDRAEQAAPLADPALGDREDPQQVPVEELEVLPDVQQPGADEADDDHPEDAVGQAARVDALPVEEPHAEPRGREDAEHGEDAVPRDQERPDLEEVRLEVDDDREEAHEAARSMRVIASSFGRSASVSWIGSATFLPVSASRIGEKTLFLLAPVSSTRWFSAASIGSGFQTTSRTVSAARLRLALASGSSAGTSGSRSR